MNQMQEVVLQRSSMKHWLPKPETVIKKLFVLFFLPGYLPVPGFQFYFTALPPSAKKKNASTWICHLTDSFKKANGPDFFSELDP